MKNRRLHYILIPAAILCFGLLLFAGPGAPDDNTGVLAADTTASPSPSITVTPSADPSPSATVSPSAGPTPSAEVTPSAAVSPTPSAAATPSAAVSPTTTPSATPTAAPSPTAKPTPTATPTPSPTPTPTPDPDEGPSEGAVIVSLTAFYSGENVLVGEEYDLEKLTVYAIYDDGYVQETKDFSVTGRIISKEGDNTFVAMALGVTGTFNVYGKRVASITAESARYSFTVGNAPDTQDLKVQARYSDNSYDYVKEGYVISPSVFTEPGSQTIAITYRGSVATIPVTVKEAPEMRQLNVFYKGGDVHTNCPIDRNDLTVNAIYVDNTSERITTYELLTNDFLSEGEQKITVSYRDQTASVKVNVLPLEVTSIRARYLGDEVIIGTEYDPRYLYVYATYSNGNEERTDAYTVYNKIIRYNGDNTIKIYLGDFSTSVTIVGCEPGEPDFTYVSTAECNSNGYDISIETAIPKILDTDVTVIKKISKAKLKHLHRILGTKTESYLGFTYGFENNDHEQYLPLTVRLKLPADFKPEYTELYYSPNNKTILGCMNKMAVNEDTLQITIYKAGTYMLVYDPDKYVVEETPEDEEEEEEED
ncbi:MAG: bacterial Ig-like domain-containing protein [Lachnospiraceae bacterium]|nr:bacterial Ig-like domain-containing protein [Lachnospiraceae bacterium]